MNPRTYRQRTHAWLARSTRSDQLRACSSVFRSARTADKLSWLNFGFFRTYVAGFCSSYCCVHPQHNQENIPGLYYTIGLYYSAGTMGLTHMQEVSFLWQIYLLVEYIIIYVTMWIQKKLYRLFTQTQLPYFIQYTHDDFGLYCTVHRQATGSCTINSVWQ